MEVDVIKITTSEVIIRRLDAQFARYGIPKGLRTDGGANLVSEEIEAYLNEMGIQHHHTTPLWSNSLELMVKWRGRIDRLIRF